MDGSHAAVVYLLQLKHGETGTWGACPGKEQGEGGEEEEEEGRWWSREK